MKKLLLVLIFLCFVFPAFSQSFDDSIYVHRQKYKQEFIDDENSPLKGNDTSYLRFFKPDVQYRVIADFTLTPKSIPFKIETHSGKKKSYRQYGLISFKLNNRPYTLHVYQSMDLMNNPEYRDYLFIPFNDLTNYVETYGGGRYIDVSIKDIKERKLILDFNKCYNPYCAFASGYSCPIPPKENKLRVAVRAGEKSFGREVKE